MGLSRDPIVNVINNGVKGDIRLLLENRRLRGALQLTLSGVDLMAYLGMPKAQQDVKRVDFVRWADTHIKLPCKEQITGLELYGARCAALHAYATESRISRDGKCRQVIWMSEASPEVIYRPKKRPNLVLVSIPALAEAFFQGIDRFLIEVYSDPDRGNLVDERFGKTMHDLPGPGHDNSRDSRV